MELQFTKDAHGMWVSEFEVSSDFNLHIERTKGGIISLYQRTTGGGWDHVDAFEYVRHQASIDFDCSALIYPKWCKIESEVEPSYAAITTDGEVTEIKSQSKEVEITANGVTEIAPDAGFGYLSGVKVNVNVPQSGGGDAPSGGGSGLKYYDTTNSDSMIKMLLMSTASIVKLYNNDWVIGPSGISLELGAEAISKATAFGVDWSMEIIVYGERKTTKQFFEGMGLSIDSLSEITKEQFYNLGA